MANVFYNGKGELLTPILVLRPTDGATTKDGEIYDYQIIVIKKKFFFGHYWQCEISIKNAVTGYSENESQTFDESKFKEVIKFINIPRHFFQKHHIDVLRFDDTEMTYKIFEITVKKWLKEK